MLEITCSHFQVLLLYDMCSPENAQIAEAYPEMAEFMKSDLISGLTEETLIEKMNVLADKFGDVELEEVLLEDLGVGHLRVADR